MFRGARRILCDCLICSLAWLPLFGPVRAADETRAVVLAIDAEFGVPAATSAQAIQRGAEAAAAEINAAGGVLRGRPLRVVIRNNNSMPARARDNLKELAADPDVVAVMSGKHSTVVQQLRPLIHEIGIPYLIPWATADDLADNRYAPSFIFRLSLRDSWAAVALAGSTDRRAIRDALERLPEYRGLVRHYRRPFAPDRHDALAASQPFMARYAADGAIVRAP